MRRLNFRGFTQAFIFSALLHLALVISIYFLPEIQLRKPLTLPPKDTVLLDLQEAPQKSKRTSELTSKQKSGPIARAAKMKAAAPRKARPSLQALTPSFKTSRGGGVETGLVSGLQQDGDTEPAFDDPANYGLSAKTYDKGNAIRGFLEAIHTRVNNALIFDSILAQYGHFGTVYLQFEVDKRGVLKIETIRANTDDRILKVHAVRSALIPGLLNPLKENLWLINRESLQLRARFQFIRSQTRTTLWDRDPELISGYSLTFRRFTPERAVPRTLSQHLVNGGIDYDLFAMYEAWQKFNKARERRRLDVDPFAVYKADPLY